MRYGACRFEDAEDHAQEIGMCFVKRRAVIRRPLAWFYYSAYKRAVETRKEPKARTVPLKESDLCAELDDATLDCQRKFLTLGARCRRLLGYIFIEEMTLRETAAYVKKTLSHVYTRKQRCLKILRERMGAPPLEEDEA
jgi:DNA-directed RNA polymerase specialized sigma24 family protein